MWCHSPNKARQARNTKGKPRNNEFEWTREEKKYIYLYVVAQKIESGIMEGVGQTSTSLSTTIPAAAVGSRGRGTPKYIILAALMQNLPIKQGPGFNTVLGHVGVCPASARK